MIPLRTSCRPGCFCPLCSPEAAAMLNETIPERARRYRQETEAAFARMRSEPLRASDRVASGQSPVEPVRKSDAEWRQHFANLLQCDVMGVPPDGYQIAMHKRGVLSPTPPPAPDLTDPLYAYRPSLEKQKAHR